MAVDQQTLKDLEFNEIREWLGTFAIEKTAKERIANLRPIPHFDEIEYQLNKTKEFLDIKIIGEKFPSLDFQEIDREIDLLPIENASISLEGFVRILNASRLTNELIYFFNKREKEYPLLAHSLSEVHYTKEIIDSIEKVFDKYGKVKDNASANLALIRNGMNELRKKINSNFDRLVRNLIKENVLGDTKETFVNDRRVLTVLSQYKRKIPGAVAGSSNTGSLTYIEPQINVPLNNEMEMLMDDERKEIFKILQLLRRELNGNLPLISSYQSVLCELDFMNAKTKLAIDMKANLPHISASYEIELIDAYHPLLRRANSMQGKATYSQKVTMDKFSRMLVISGPNAGGKSITLKSVGLLQLMLQSGLLVPVEANSKMCLFQNIISDIGDNQSIENELSTYSYRLKRMKQFIDICNKHTLILIDEFGTGSDPDLGGALAEAIFEELYSKKCFGVITTHYTNIKLKADQLRNACNGSMMFNTETLEPLYKFIAGQPGSSFTFEVATINGIPPEIIAQAKEKLDEKKVKLDQLLSELQKEKTYLSRLNQEHIEAQEIAQEALNNYEDLRDEYERKLQRIKDSGNQQERLVQLGKKMESFINSYVPKSRKLTINDSLLSDVKKYLAVEKSKIEAAKEVKKAKAQPKLQVKPKTKSKKPQPDQFHRDKIKEGSTVKIISTRQTGIVEEIAGKNITISFGFARVKVTLDKLMWVK